MVEGKTGAVPVDAYYISLSGFTGIAVGLNSGILTEPVVLLDGRDLGSALISHKVVVPEHDAIETASRLATGAICGDPQLLGTAHGWIWAVPFTSVSRGDSAFLVCADGTALSHKKAASLHETAVQAGDPLGSMRILNPIEGGASRRAEVMRRYPPYLKRAFGSITLEGPPADASLGCRSLSLAKLYEPIADLDLLDVSAPEGGVVERRHLRYERDRGLRNKAVAAYKKKHRTVACEACGFNFGASMANEAKTTSRATTTCLSQNLDQSRIASQISSCAARTATGSSTGNVPGYRSMLSVLCFATQPPRKRPRSNHFGSG